jgi:hypothetical protein
MLRKLGVLLIFALAIGAILVAGRLRAQPGTQADPAVSLSYLKTALSMQPVSIEGGEDFRVAPGKGVALLQGKVRLTPPSGTRCWILDVKTGVVVQEAVEMTPGSYFLLVADDPKVRFSLQAWESSTLALPGGSGE